MRSVAGTGRSLSLVLVLGSTAEELFESAEGRRSGQMAPARTKGVAPGLVGVA